MLGKFILASVVFVLLVAAVLRARHVAPLPPGKPTLRATVDFPEETWVGSLVFGPDRKVLAVMVGSSNTVTLWDFENDKNAATFKPGGSIICSAALSPDGRTLTVGCYDRVDFKYTGEVRGKIILKNLVSGKVRVMDDGKLACIESLSFSPDGMTMASRSSGGELKLWDVSSGKCIASFEGHTGGISSVAFSPDGKTLVTSDWGDDTIRLWDVSSGECLATLMENKSHANTLAFSPDGKTLASGHRADEEEPAEIKLWGVPTARHLTTFKGHAGSVRSLAFRPDGKLLASAGGQQEPSGGLKIWDVATGKCISTLKGHSDEVKCVTFSRDGRTLVSAGTAAKDRTIKLWDIPATIRPDR